MANKEGAEKESVKKEAAKTQPQNTMVKDAMALFVITIVAGLLLGAVYTITKDPIAAAEEKTTNEAYEAVYEGAEFESDADITKAVEDFASQVTAGELDDEVFSYTDVKLMEARAAMVDGTQAGYVLKISGKGYGGDVVIALGITKEGEVIGVNIVDNSNETPGLGQNSSKEDWYSQYIGTKSSDGTVQVTKTGESDKIDAITGATITSNAVTRAVNVALKFVAEQAE